MKDGFWKRTTSSLSAILFAIISIYIATQWESAYTPPSRRKSENVGFSELITIPLNGQIHVATIRTNLNVTTAALKSSKDNKDFPVLLILHGGPGASDIPFLHKSDYMLEDHFIVVHYDQRTAGKTCKYYEEAVQTKKDDTITTTNVFTIDQHLQDAVAMINYLRDRFQQDKIYLLGGSWGSILAMMLARDVPQYIHHVAARGLCVNVSQSEILSYNFVADTFPEFTLKVPQLPPYGSNRVDDMIEQRKWLKLAGGMSYKCRHTKNKCTKWSLEFGMIKALVASKEMSWSDLRRFKRCFIRTLHEMWEEVEHYDAARDVPKLTVPVVVLHGRHDYTTAHSLVEDYILKKLDAPQKSIIWFEQSAHSPHLEESERFQRTLIEEFLGKKNV